MSYQETQIQNFIVNRLSKAKYEELLQNNEIQDNELYLIKEDEMDANGDPIHNVGTPKLSSDAVNRDYVDKLINSTLNAANKDYVDTLVNSTSVEILTQTKTYTDSVSTETLNQAKEYTNSVSSSLSDTVDALFDTFTADNNKIHNELSNNIDNKIFLSDEENGERYTDLSIIKLTEEEYNLLVFNKQIDHNTLYVVESEKLNAYGNVISNVIMTDDPVESEAATKHYVDAQLAEIEQKFLSADNDNVAPTESPTFSGTVRLTETPENECDDDVIVNAGWVRKNQINLPSYDSITRTSIGTTLTASQFIAETDGWFAFQITGTRHTNNQIYLDINGQKAFRALPYSGMSNYTQPVQLTTQFLYLHAGTVISCSYNNTESSLNSKTTLSEFTVIHTT